MNQTFECDRCGACCKHLIVEAGWIDAEREPEIRKHAHPLLNEAEFRGGLQAITLYDLHKCQCPFLLKDASSELHACMIHPTRPNECVAVEPGDAKCQQARLIGELPLLKDVTGELPSTQLLRDSCRDYGIVFEEFFHE